MSECVSVLVTVRFFADYDMTGRETRSRQPWTWCFSAWLESSSTPFVFIHTVDRSSLKLPPSYHHLRLPLFLSLPFSTPLSPSRPFFSDFFHFNVITTVS